MNAPEPRTVLILAEKIVKAEQELANLKSEWESIFAPPTAKRVGSKRDGSFPARVKAIINSSPDKEFMIAEVAELVQADALKVGRALFRLTETGHITNVRRGVYSSLREHQEEAA